MESLSEPLGGHGQPGVSKLRRWIRLILLAVLGLAVGLYLVLLISFQTAKQSRLSRLESGSNVFESELGPIEYAADGEGPAVLVLHGTPAGYDQGVLVSNMLSDGGFTCISPSRPGYLRTPITIGHSPAEQADAMVLLLDGLGIEQVAVMGVSGGGPAAIELAKRHPERLTCLVLMVAVAESWDPQWFEPYEISSVQVLDQLFGDGFVQWLLFTYVDWFPNHVAGSLEHESLSDETKRLLLEDRAKLDQILDVGWTVFPPNRRRDGYANDRKQFKTIDLGSVEGIHHSTLVVHGTEDKIVSFSGAQAIASRLENAESLWVEGGQHFTFITHSEDIWPEVIDFIGRHTMRSSDPTARD